VIFQDLPLYKSEYKPGTAVFFVPLWENCAEPVHGIIDRKTALGDYLILNASGIMRSEAPVMRPSCTEVLAAWMEGLSQIMKAEYEVAYIAMAPKSMKA